MMQYSIGSILQDQVVTSYFDRTELGHRTKGYGAVSGMRLFCYVFFVHDSCVKCAFCLPGVSCILCVHEGFLCFCLSMFVFVVILYVYGGGLPIVPVCASRHITAL